jgi:hypothetical protein
VKVAKELSMKIPLAFVGVLFGAVVLHAQEPSTFKFEVQARMPLETRTVKNAPYSAEVVTDHMQQLGDGNRIVEHSSGRVYRDKEGRVRREEDRPSGNPVISIVDPVAGVAYSLDPERRIAWKSSAQAGIAIMNKLDAAKMEIAKIEASKAEAEMKRRGEAGAVVELRKKEEAARRAGEAMTVEAGGGIVTMRRTPGSGAQHKEEALPPQTLEGVRVEGRRTTTTIAAGAIGNEWPITIVSEEWTSPDLQVLVLTDRKDPRNGDSSYRLQRIVRGEPSVTLFQVPTDYEVRETGIRRFEYQREER